jgi:lipoyl(octanoyl) transferase
VSGTPWRLIVDGARDGARNMAVDRALLASRAAGGPPTLRLYRWRVPTASLGRFQQVADVDAAACARFGVDVVRRITGGRGVLHDDELTYSVTVAEADGVPRGVAASYRYLGTALLAAYETLGVPAELTDAHRGVRGSAACYLAATQADLSLAGAKLSGSAQVWRDGACLQHGSFVLERDVAREAAVFRLTDEAASALEADTVTIAGALGRRPMTDQVAAAVCEGFVSALGVELREGALTTEEEAAAARFEPESRVDLGGGDVRA